MSGHLKSICWETRNRREVSASDDKRQNLIKGCWGSGKDSKKVTLMLSQQVPVYNEIPAQTFPSVLPHKILLKVEWKAKYFSRWLLRYCVNGETTRWRSFGSATHYLGDLGQFAHFFLLTIIGGLLSVRPSNRHNRCWVQTIRYSFLPSGSTHTFGLKQQCCFW